jgi:trans-2,3-dihydro-3-hydroxyanthranilate isomerase
MKTFPLIQVDAFTNRPMSGNPCAVIFNTDDFDDELMLAIAREMNLSETAFVRRSSVADFGARYFTPAEEVPLAGHPTIATAFALVESGLVQLQGNPTTITLELKVGPIPVDIYSQAGVIQTIVMTQKPPEFLALYHPNEIMPVFSLDPADALPDVPIQTVSTGTPQLMVPVRSLDALHKAQVNVPAYTALRARSDFFSPHLFHLGGLTEAGDTFARHFGVPPDTPEDPFTGSATGGMGAYLWHYHLIQRPKFIAEQGHWMRRPGQATVEIEGPPEAIRTVRVGGQAVAVLRGELTL